MRYVVRLHGEEHEVRIDGDRVVVDGVEGRWVRSTDGEGDVLVLAGRELRFRPELSSEAGVGRIETDGGWVTGDVVTPRERLAATSRAAATASGADELRSEIPGVVREVRIAAGESVAVGQVVLVLEAMKMQNEVRARSAGRVAELRVAVGDRVEADALLAVVEPEDGPSSAGADG